MNNTNICDEKVFCEANQVAIHEITVTPDDVKDYNKVNKEEVFGDFLRETGTNVMESLDDRYARFIIKTIKDKMYLAASNGFSECNVYLFNETIEFFTVGYNLTSDSKKLFGKLGNIANRTLREWLSKNKIQSSDGHDERGSYIIFKW